MAGLKPVMEQRVANGPRRGSQRGKSVTFEILGDPFIVERKENVVAGLLGVAEVMVIHADTKVGKTQIASHLSFCIATGATFFGRQVKQGSVLYLCLEKGPVTRKRFRALQRLHDGIRPPIALSTTPINLLSPDDVEAVILAARDLSDRYQPISLIVVDTLNRAMPGVDENSAGPVGEAFNALTLIAEQTRAAIVLLHHNVKGPGGKLRGSSVIAASVDVVLSLEKIGDDIREAIVTAANDTTEGQTFRFRMPVVEIAPATDDQDADTTVIIEPFDEDRRSAKGTARTRAPIAAKADQDRAERVLSLLRDVAVNGRCLRTTLLGRARQQEIVSPLNPKSGAEQLRKALSLLSTSGSVSYNDQEVSLAEAS